MSQTFEIFFKGMSLISGSVFTTWKTRVKFCNLLLCTGYVGKCNVESFVLSESMNTFCRTVGRSENLREYQFGD